MSRNFIASLIGRGRAYLAPSNDPTPSETNALLWDEINNTIAWGILPGANNGNVGVAADYAALRLASDNFIHVPGQGLFYRNAGGTIDNGVQIGNYKRIGVFGAYRPEWWTDLDIDGNAIVHGAQNINSAIEAAVNDGVYAIKSDLSRLWTLSNEIVLQSTSDFSVDGLYIKRENQKSTTLSVAYTSGTSITVASSSGFRIGDIIALVYVAGGTAGQSTDDTSGASRNVITNIVGNVITVNTGFTLSTNNPANYPIGSKVVRVFDLIRTNGAAGTFRFTNMKIDGNKANNIITYDWKLNAVHNGSVDRLIIENLEMYDLSNEGWIGRSNAILSNWNCYNCNGSLYHVSNSVSTVKCHLVAENFQVKDTNLQRTLNGHSRGMIEFSARVHGVKLTNVKAFQTTAIPEILGSISATDLGEVGIFNSQFENFAGIGGCGFSTTSQECLDWTIVGNQFINCGDTEWRGYDVRKAKSARRIRIADNYFLNCRTNFQDCAEIHISNNRIVFDGTPAYTAVFNTDITAWRFHNWDRLIIENNVFEGPKVFNQYIQYAMLIRQPTNQRKDTGGVDLPVLYPQETVIQNNYINNWRTGIGYHATNPNTTITIPVAGWTYRNNTIILPDANHTANGITCWGAQIPAGAFCSDLTVVSQNGSNTDQYPIVLCGLDATADASVLSSYTGAILDGWKVLGPSIYDIMVGGSTGGRSNYNVIARNGISTASTGRKNYNASRSFVDTPITISATLLPALTTPASPILQQLGENNTVY